MTDEKRIMLNDLVNLEQARILHELTGTRYLMKPDGDIVVRYPDGTEGPIPVYEDYDEQDFTQADIYGHGSDMWPEVKKEGKT